MRGLRALFAVISVTVAASASAAAPGRVYTIVIDKMKFGPAPAGLRVGDTIQWVNRDFFRHSATAADHSFDVEMNPHQVGKILLRHPGAIAFTCKYHPAMKGVLNVGK